MRMNRFPSFDGSSFNFNFYDNWADSQSEYEFGEGFAEHVDLDHADVLSVRATIGETKVSPIDTCMLSNAIKLYDSNTTSRNQTTVVESSDKDETSQKDNEEDKDSKQDTKFKLLEPIKFTRWGRKDDRRLYKTL